MTFEGIVARVEEYYAGKLREHGRTARGVDWNSQQSQALRFSQLLRICDGREPFSINDYGCGYGALVDYLIEQRFSFTYYGYDISSHMIDQARQAHGGRTQCAFTTDESSMSVADYSVASGVFNVRLETPEEEWIAYVRAILERLAALSRRGFAFNMLTRHSDVDRREARLFYADPVDTFEYCRSRFSRHVALLHDYPLYEFTILVRL